jgi:hypothetical protein
MDIDPDSTSTLLNWYNVLPSFNEMPWQVVAELFERIVYIVKGNHPGVKLPKYRWRYGYWMINSLLNSAAICKVTIAGH